MSRYSLQEFVQQTAQQDLHQGTFELESDRMLEVNLDGMVWMKMGAMISYRGRIKFTREGVFEHGLGNLLKKAVSGEGTKLTKAEGNGKMYLADRGKKSPSSSSMAKRSASTATTSSPLRAPSKTRSN